MKDAGSAALIHPWLSVILDLSRFAFAFLVLCGHLTQPLFSANAMLILTKVAVAAVGGFFVLSGFTIRMLYHDPDKFGARAYFVERWSRIWSVTLPALLLTVVLDYATAQGNPAFYEAYFGKDADNPVFRLAVNALGLSQVWGQDISPLSNNPFWSISYELGFYAVYGLLMLRRPLAAIALLVALGPQIAVMFLVWLVGAAAYDFTRSSVWSARRKSILAAMWAGAGIAVFLVMARYGDALLEALFGLFHTPIGRVAPTLIGGALLFSGAFVVIAMIVERWRGALPARWLKTSVRHLGNMTFPLYTLHFPLLVFACALGLYDRSSLPQLAGLGLAIVAVAAIATPLTDILKRIMRRAWTKAS